MPINMIRFERLAYLSLVISLVAIVLDNATPNGAKLGPVALAVVVVVVFAFGGALISATARLRKNWLRWVYAGLFTLGVAGDIWMIPSTIAAGGNILAQALTVGADALDIACICLLFSAAANAWFRTSAVAAGSHAAA